MSKNIPYNAPDGAIGYITDVTQEHFYNEPDIGLYDELEQSCYELVCDFAELIGVHLDKSEQDCRLANMVRDFVGEMLEKEFAIPFPSYGETDKERTVRLQTAKKALDGFRAEHDKQQVIQLVGNGFETGHHLYDSFSEFKADLNGCFSNIGTAWAMYNEFIQYGPAGFYNEFRCDYAFSDDYIAEYGSADAEEKFDAEKYDALHEQIRIAEEKKQKNDVVVECSDAIER